MIREERRAAALARLEACYIKWRDVRQAMVGNLYPGIVERRYLQPLIAKIWQLRRGAPLR